MMFKNVHSEDIVHKVFLPPEKKFSVSPDGELC